MSSLSLCASAMLRLVRDANEPDPIQDACGDGGDAIARGWERSAVELLKRHGYTPASFAAALASSVSAKWIHTSGLCSLLPQEP